MARRGSIFRRKDRPTFVAKIRIRGKVYEKAGFSSEDSAALWLERIRREVARAEILGRPGAGAATTLAEFFPLYKTSVRRRLTRGGAASRIRLAERLWLPEFGNRPLFEIRPEAIEEVLAREANRGTSGNTRNGALSVLSTIFSAAVRMGYARENPAARVKRAREVLPPERYLTLEEETRLLLEIPVPLLAPVVLALDGGLRAGEIGRLRARDVDLERGAVSICRTKNRQSRVVYLTLRASRVLAFWLSARPGEDERLFVAPGGRTFPGEPARREFRAAIERAGIAPLRFHDLRHAAGCRMAEAGATPAEIAAVLGHKSLAMTLRYIRHAPRNAARLVAGLLDERRRRKEGGR